MKNFSRKQIKGLLKSQTEKKRFNPSGLIETLKQKSSQNNFNVNDIESELEESLKIPFIKDRIWLRHNGDLIVTALVTISNLDEECYFQGPKIKNFSSSSDLSGRINQQNKEEQNMEDESGY